MRESLWRSYHMRWLRRAVRDLFTTLGGIGSLVFSIGIPLVVAWVQGVTWDDVGPFVLVTLVFLGVAFLLQLILAPRHIEQEIVTEDRSTIESLRAQLQERAPKEVIRKIHRHIDTLGPVDSGLRYDLSIFNAPASDVDAWVPLWRQAIDWLTTAEQILDDECPDSLTAYRRMVKPNIRTGEAMRAAIAAGPREPYGWIQQTVMILEDQCIPRIAGR